MRVMEKIWGDGFLLFIGVIENYCYDSFMIFRVVSLAIILEYYC